MSKPFAYKGMSLFKFFNDLQEMIDTYARLFNKRKSDTHMLAEADQYSYRLDYPEPEYSYKQHSYKKKRVIHAEKVLLNS